MKFVSAISTYCPKSPLGIEAIRLSEQVEDDVWVEVGRFRLIAEAEQHALVLVALGMASRLVSSATGTSLFVASPDAAKARSEIAAYDQENTPRPTTGWASRPLREGINGALIFCAILLFVDAAAGRNAFSYDWLALGNAQAGLIKQRRMVACDHRPQSPRRLARISSPTWFWAAFSGSCLRSFWAAVSHGWRS